MGEPVRILDLARNLVLLSGLRPDRDIKFEFTGVRPGEKLFEELNLQNEQFVPTAHAKILSYLSPFSADLKVMRVALEELRRIADRKDVGRLVSYLKELIPDYNPGSLLMKLAISAAATQGPRGAAEVRPNHPTAVTNEWPQPLETPANLVN
jgi:FlaA1/EpsC-like NDP-sugar epimerase